MIGSLQIFISSRSFDLFLQIFILKSCVVGKATRIKILLVAQQKYASSRFFLSNVLVCRIFFYFAII
jgi:hypothetical protein